MGCNFKLIRQDTSLDAESSKSIIDALWKWAFEIKCAKLESKNQAILFIFPSVAV